MAKNGKRYKSAAAAVTPGKSYALDEALKILKDNSKTKFVESVDVAIRLGIDAKKSDQTVRGSVDFYRHNYQEDGSSVHLAQLRNLVTSPGGTTAAALYQLEKAGFRTALSRAIWAAYERSVELGKNKKVTDPEKQE